MPEDVTPLQPNNSSSEPLEGTGTENIVRRHLQDPNHVITDEEIRNVVVGKSDDEIPQAGAELAARFGIDNDNSKPGLDDKAGKDNPEFKPPNPWDIKK